MGSGGSSATRQRKNYAQDDDEDRGLILASVAHDARLSRKFLLLILLSAAIATLGLLQSSAAVVIGAMLVSPLLGPIMAVGFGLATLDTALVRRALLTLAAGVAAAVMVAMVIVWVTPISDVTAELRARTVPTLLDLGVAVVGGVAGVYAILRRLSGVMVGVAIATALVPPLSTIGFGLATARPAFAQGAALLFLTNTLAIAFAATIVARINRFGPSLTPRQTVLQVVGIVAALGVLSIPLAISLDRIAREVAVRSIVQTSLDDLLGPNDRIDELTVTLDSDSAQIDGVVLVDRYHPDLPGELTRLAQRRMSRRIKASIVQLRQQSDGTQFEDAFDRRLTALERREEETVRVLTSLTAGGAIARAAITLDPQARRAVVAVIPGVADDAVTLAIAAARTANPSWLITTATIEAVESPPAE